MWIANRAGTIQFPYDAELLIWLQENYPYSKYQLVEATDELVS